MPTDLPVMVISGTSKGIGRYLAEHYAGQGYRVVGCSRSHAPAGLPNYEHVQLDVNNEDQVIDLFSKVADQHGRIDALINNAGVSYLSPALITQMDVVHNVLNTNVAAAFLFSREAARIMRKKKTGRIVNFSSIAAPMRIEGEAVYAAAKSAVVSLTQVLAKEFAPLGITVNAVGPSLIRTEMTAAMPQKLIDKNVEMQALKRLGETKDVANVIDFFLQPASDFITGQVVYLGGA